MLIFFAGLACLVVLALLLGTQTFWNGQGGTMVFTPTTGGTMTAANKQNKTSHKNKINEVTNAGSVSQEQYIAGVNGQQMTITVFWDSTLHPEANGVYPGNTGTLRENFGNSGHYYTTNYIIEEVAYSQDAQQGAIAYDLTLRGTTSPVYT